MISTMDNIGVLKKQISIHEAIDIERIEVVELLKAQRKDLKLVIKTQEEIIALLKVKISKYEGNRPPQTIL